LKERLEILVNGFEYFQKAITSKRCRSCLGARKVADMESIGAILKNLQNSLKMAKGNESGEQPQGV
jgi:hypothetical protein